MHRPIGAVAPDLDRGSPRPLSQQRADALALGDRVDGGQHALSMSEAQSECLRLWQQPLLDALDRPGERTASADRIESIAIAEAGRFEDALRIADAAHRP